MNLNPMLEAIDDPQSLNMIQNEKGWILCASKQGSISCNIVTNYLTYYFLTVI
jgi:hypothetical protein